MAFDEIVKDAPQLAGVFKPGDVLEKIVSDRFGVGADQSVVLPEARMEHRAVVV
jgi:hypothetical protein